MIFIWSAIVNRKREGEGTWCSRGQRGGEQEGAADVRTVTSDERDWGWDSGEEGSVCCEGWCVGRSTGCFCRRPLRSDVEGLSWNRGEEVGETCIRVFQV